MKDKTKKRASSSPSIPLYAAVIIGIVFMAVVFFALDAVVSGIPSHATSNYWKAL